MSRKTRARMLAASLGAAGLAALCFDGPALADEPTKAPAGSAAAAPSEPVGKTYEVPVGQTYQVPVGETHQVPAPNPEEEAEYRAAWSEYGKSVGNRYLVGLNSLLTFPADPIMDTVKPREEFNKLPLGIATRYLAGFGTGVLLSVYRASMGVFDVVFAPLTPMKELSPEPRWMIFPGVEAE